MYMLIVVVKANIETLESEFNKLKKRAIKLLEASSVEVKDVVYELSTLPAAEMTEHKVFIEEKSDKLEESKNHTALFRGLNLYWTYLSPHLLKHLVHQLPALNEMQEEMDVYMIRLQEFRTQTPLELFYQVDKEHIKPPKGFTDLVATFKAIKSKRFTSRMMTLQDVEDFRLEYGKHYKLRDLALMLLPQIEKNCFIIKFFVPVAIVELLRSNVPQELFLKFGITKLEVSGTCIFRDDNQISVQTMPPYSIPVTHSRPPVPRYGTTQDCFTMEITPNPHTLVATKVFPDELRKICSLFKSNVLAYYL